MKAVLVIDMPKSCRECRLYRPYEFRQAVHCGGNFRDINFSDGDKPYWCPLKPLPQRYDEDVMREQKGWNRCLDEILGDSK